ncbi:MAG: hypothetical protein V1857_01290 [archaeon]
MPSQGTLNYDLIEMEEVVSLGFLGTSASYAADFNLIVQILVLALLLAGAYYGKIAKFRTHGRLMSAAIIVQFGAFMFWMAPSLLLNISALGTFGIGPALTVLHVLTGMLAVILAISSGFHKALISPQLRWTMRATFLTWSLAAVSGISFYAYYYLAR